jgi:ABC-type sugar transport system substrate-binding protein
MFRVRYTPAAALVLSGALLMSACSSDGNDESGSSGGASASASVAQAAEVVKSATEGLVHIPSGEYVPADQFTAVKDWPGVTEPVEVTPDKKVIAISCGAQACNDTADKVVEAAESVGWAAETANISGGSDAASLNEAFASAIAQAPDVIITVAISSQVVGSSLDDARSAGILTVSIADVGPVGGPKQYDASIRVPNSGKAQLQAYQAIADSNGTADVLLVDSTDFPDTHNAAKSFETTIETCDGCSVTTVPWLITDALDPTKVNSIISAALNSNPNATALALPYTVGLPAVIAAVRASGRDIDIYACDLDESSAPALKAGDIKSTSGFSFGVAAYSAVDAALRSFAGLEPVTVDQTPLLAHIYTQDNLPSGDLDDFGDYLDYRASFADLWKQ